MLCAHARSEFEGILCRGVLGTPTGGALGHWDNVPVAVCRLSVGNGRDPVKRCTLNIDTWDYSHAPLRSGIRKHCFLKAAAMCAKFGY